MSRGELGSPQTPQKLPKTLAGGAYCCNKGSLGINGSIAALAAVTRWEDGVTITYATMTAGSFFGLGDEAFVKSSTGAELLIPTKRCVAKGRSQDIIDIIQSLMGTVSEGPTEADSPTDAGGDLGGLCRGSGAEEDNRNESKSENESEEEKEERQAQFRYVYVYGTKISYFRHLSLLKRYKDHLFFVSSSDSTPKPALEERALSCCLSLEIDRVIEELSDHLSTSFRVRKEDLRRNIPFEFLIIFYEPYQYENMRKKLDIYLHFGRTRDKVEAGT
ncbi:hypothetical protein DL96DRAFT_1567641 [Flagelloscypha sp. PMI_526]|nr:hypothetical protein DL96DRAFT_1567641 [Flagelloscypha sp. PMI_526]